MESKIWLSSPHMGGNEQKYIKEAFDNNWIAPLGENVNKFEENLAAYIDENKYVTALSSGTAALHLALLLAEVKRDDYVLCQSMTFAASANPIKYVNANPVFIDSELDTWNLCPHHTEQAIQSCIKEGKKPAAIIAVHLYGMPYKNDEIKKIATQYDIPVIEDSAEALGSQYKNQKCGSFGDYGILSFNGNKIITTSGGGALLTNNKKLKDKALFLATQARDDAPHYQHSVIGYNYRLSNISAGIGRGQLEVIDERVKQRRAVNHFYQEIFKNYPFIKMQSEPSVDFYSNFWLSAFYVDLPNGYEIREKIRKGLQEAQIESRPLWKPMHLQPIFKDSPYFGKNNSALLFEKGLCLPSGSNLTTTEKGKIKATLFDLLKNV